MAFTNVTPEEFAEKMNDPDSVVLDVRTPQELQEGEIPGYVMINIMSPDFTSAIDELDKEKTYLVYCRSGMRSAEACAVMESMGFVKLHNLSGGIKAWNLYQKS